MTPERAGPERASRGGVSLAWLHANSAGPHRGMRSPSDGSEPTGQEKSLTQ